MECSLCIPTYKRADCLNNLLSCVIGMNDKRISEVLIGVSYKKEDSFNDTTRHLIRALEILGIKCRVKSNIEGLIRAKEWFKEKAKNDILLIVDDDGIIHRKYLDLLYLFLDEDVAAASGSIQTPLDIGYYKDYAYSKIKNPLKGTVCNTVSVNKDGLVEILNKYQVFMLQEAQRYRCECLVGTAMFIRKEFLTPDRNYERGACNYEEFDYTYDAYRKGMKLLYDSSQVAFHLHKNTGGMREKPKKLKEENSLYFRKKFEL